MIPSPMTKDPDAILDYTWDWSAWLASGETISTATVNGSGVTIGANSVIGGTKVVARISGGTAATTASATCHITTSTGQQDDRTIQFAIADR